MFHPTPLVQESAYAHAAHRNRQLNNILPMFRFHRNIGLDFSIGPEFPDQRLQTAVPDVNFNPIGEKRDSVDKLMLHFIAFRREQLFPYGFDRIAGVQLVMR